MNILIWCVTGLLFLLLLLPTAAYLYGGLEERRREILAGLSEEAIKLYLKQFQPRNSEHSKEVERVFNDYYARQFGRRHFVIPMILLAGIAGSLLFWSALSVTDWLYTTPLGPGHLPGLAVVAIGGAYMYCVYDLIGRWAFSDLSPSDLLGLSFRLVIAVPMAYAIASAFTPSIALTIAFLLGVFPTKTLLKIVRRSAAKKLDAGDLPESGESELQKLNGIDLKIAECLAAEGITTVLQLAYFDPVKLAIRTNLGFSYIVDCVSQALLYIYTGDRFQDFVKASLRGSYEVCDLNRALTSDTSNQSDEAKMRFEAIAKQLQYSPDVLRNLFTQVGGDPYTEFLYEVWS